MIDAALKRKIARLTDEELKQLQIASTLRTDGLNGLTEPVLEIASALFTEDGIAWGGKACPYEAQAEILDVVRKRRTASAGGAYPDALKTGGSVATGEAEDELREEG